MEVKVALSESLASSFGQRFSSFIAIIQYSWGHDMNRMTSPEMDIKLFVQNEADFRGQLERFLASIQMHIVCYL